MEHGKTFASEADMLLEDGNEEQDGIANHDANVVEHDVEI